MKYIGIASVLVRLLKNWLFFLHDLKSGPICESFSGEVQAAIGDPIWSASKEGMWTLRLWEILKGASELFECAVKTKISQKNTPLWGTKCAILRISSFCLIQGRPLRQVVLTAGIPAPGWRCWKLRGPSATASLLVGPLQGPMWWQGPAAAWGNWHCCPFMLEVAVKVTRPSASLSWNALSWELLVWQKFRNQKNASTPNNTETNLEREVRGGYFILWRLLF